jgi:hypothetical protein
MIQTQLSPKEVCERGDEIYTRDLRDKMETPENIRKILVIDVDSSDYEMDKDHLTAIHRLRDRRPEGVFFSMRIGYPSLGKIGGGWTGASEALLGEPRPPKQPELAKAS